MASFGSLFLNLLLGKDKKKDKKKKVTLPRRTKTSTPSGLPEFTQPKPRLFTPKPIQQNQSFPLRAPVKPPTKKQTRDARLKDSLSQFRPASRFLVEDPVRSAAKVLSRPKTLKAMFDSAGNPTKLIDVFNQAKTEEALKFSVKPKGEVSKFFLGEEPITGIGDSKAVSNIAEKLSGFTGQFGIDRSETEKLTQAGALPLFGLLADPRLGGGKAKKKVAATALTVLDEVKGILKTPKEPKTIVSRAKGFLESLQTKAVSEFTPVRNLEKRLLTQAGLPPAKLDMARKLEQLAGSAGKAEADILQFKTNVVDVAGKDNIDSLNQYLFLRRTEDRLLTDPTRKSVGSWTAKKARQGLVELEQSIGKENFDLIANAAENNFQKAMDDALKLQVDSGRMSQEVYDTIRADNDFYAGFKVMRHIEDSEKFAKNSGLSTAQDYVKQIKGIKSEDFNIQDIVQSSSEQIYRSRILAEKNLAMQDFAKLADIDGADSLVKKLKTNETLASAVKKPGEWEVVTYFDNGAEKRLAVPKDVGTALLGLNKTQRGIISTALGNGSKLFRAGVTSANAAFQVVNQFSDVARSALISKYGIQNPIDAVRFPLDWIQALGSSFKGNFGNADELYKSFLQSGAANSTIQREITPGVFRQTFGIKPTETNLLKQLGSKAKTVLGTIPRISNAIEETAKLLGFKRAVRLEGINKLPEKEAIEKLKEIVTEIRNFSGSPDFARGTPATRELGLIFPFLNARIQGVASDIGRLGGKHGTKEAQAAWTRLSAAVGIPTTILAVKNQSEGYKEDYDQIPDWEKENYFMIPREQFFTDAEGNKVREYWRIPKREVVKLYANVIEGFVDFAKNRDVESLKSLGASTLENISPVNIGGNTFGERGESVVSSINPILKTPFELSTNRDTFRRRDIVPQSLQGAEAQEQFFNNTPPAFVKAGELTKQSPLMIQAAVQGLTGGLFTQFEGGEPLSGRSKATTLPILKRFTRSSYVSDTETSEIIKKYEVQETTAQVKLKREARGRAEEIIKQIENKEINKSQLKEELLNLASQDEALAEKVLQEMEGIQLGLSRSERELKGLNIGNGIRARAIVELTDSIKTNKEKKAFILDLAQKKIVTEDVLKQILLIISMENKVKERQ